MVIFNKIGLKNVMIEMVHVKYKTLENQQKQTHQRLIQEQRVYLLSVIVLCIERLHLIIMVILFLSTDVIQISIITFYYNSFSILTNVLLKSMGRIRSQLLLADNTWGIR